MWAAILRFISSILADLHAYLHSIQDHESFHLEHTFQLGLFIRLSKWQVRPSFKVVSRVTPAGSRLQQLEARSAATGMLCYKPVPQYIASPFYSVLCAQQSTRLPTSWHSI